MNGKQTVLSTEEIRSKLQGQNIKKIARNTGISYATVLSIARRSDVNPKYSTIAALSTYIAGMPQ